MKKTDAQIQQAVLRELMSDTRVSETEVGVQVKQGIVTLSGIVSDWAKSQAALEAAHRVYGVLDVANDLEVRPPGGARRTDAEVARAVRDTLEWDVWVPDQQIRSTVANGCVTLEGQVPFHRQKDDTERAVRNLDGVVNVSNRIEVVPPPVASADLRKSIQSALERQAEREAQQIELEVQDGRVFLRGVVHSLREREAVLGAVKATPGVRLVENSLRIEPYSQ
jgi:osmotically-inducible protein OsmY